MNPDESIRINCISALGFIEFDIYFLGHAFPLFLCFKHVSFDNGLYFNAIEYIMVVTVQKMQTLLQVLPLPSSKDSYLQNEAECKTLITCENEFYLQENKKSFSCYWLRI